MYRGLGNAGAMPQISTLKIQGAPEDQKREVPFKHFSTHIIHFEDPGSPQDQKREVWFKHCTTHMSIGKLVAVSRMNFKF